MTILSWIYHVEEPDDYKRIPVVINNFNRLTMLRKLIASLEVRGYHNIVIIDNASTYPPLLDWYRNAPYTIYRLDRNYGHLSIWETGIYRQFTSSYFAYTDSDIEIDPACPDDFMKRFIGLLKKYPRTLKVGFSLRIDDLPDCFANKQQVVEWESGFWKKELEEGIYEAPIDTTFAIYRPFFKGELVDVDFQYIRTGPPYVARHQPWYSDTLCPDPEELYYISNVRTLTHWSQKEKQHIAASDSGCSSGI